MVDVLREVQEDNSYMMTQDACDIVRDMGMDLNAMSIDMQVHTVFDRFTETNGPRGPYIAALIAGKMLIEVYKELQKVYKVDLELFTTNSYPGAQFRLRSKAEEEEAKKLDKKRSEAMEDKARKAAMKEACEAVRIAYGGNARSVCAQSGECVMVAINASNYLPDFNRNTFIFESIIADTLRGLLGTTAVFAMTQLNCAYLREAMRVAKDITLEEPLRSTTLSMHAGGWFNGAEFMGCPSELASVFEFQLDELERRNITSKIPDVCGLSKEVFNRLGIPDECLFTAATDDNAVLAVMVGHHVIVTGNLTHVIHQKLEVHSVLNCMASLDDRINILKNIPLIGPLAFQFLDWMLERFQADRRLDPARNMSKVVRINVDEFQTRATKLMSAQIDKRREAAHEEVRMVNERIASYRQRLQDDYRAYDTATATVALLSKAESTDELSKKSCEAVLNNTLLQYVAINGVNITFITKPLIVNDPRGKCITRQGESSKFNVEIPVWYYLGAFMVKGTMEVGREDRKPTITRISGMRIDTRGSQMHAPHVNAEGSPCLGDAAPRLRKAVREGNFVEYIATVLDYLLSVNVDDAWGGRVNYWPEATQEQYDKFWADRTGVNGTLLDIIKGEQSVTI